MTPVGSLAPPDASDLLRDAADDIHCQLIELKHYVLSQQTLLAAVAPVQVRALMAAYDIYAWILDEALSGVTSNLAHRAPSRRPVASGDDRFENLGRHLNQVAADVTARLAELKPLLEAREESWSEPHDVRRESAEDWNLAIDGLFGPTGVISSFAQVMNLGWSPGDTSWALAQR